MVSDSRWQTAQEYERSYWEKTAREIATGSISQLDWYRWRGGEIVRRLRAADLEHLTSGQARAVEIGSGPVGVVGFFPARERVAIDPLEDFYGANTVLTALRNDDVAYRQGLGEKLPCESAAYDLAIAENCIDHVRDMGAVMAEIRRVLTPDGLLYLTVNCRNSAGYWVHRLLSRLQIDRGHPHTFTRSKLERFLEKNGFQPVLVEAGSFFDAFLSDIRSSEARTRLKAVLGVSEFVVTVIARRAGAPAERFVERSSAAPTT